MGERIEVPSSNDQGRRVFDRVRARGCILWDGLCRNVRSSLTVSISFESSIALVCFYAGIGYFTASLL